MLQFLLGIAIGVAATAVFFLYRRIDLTRGLTSALHRMIDTVQSQQDFISKNINERIVYTNADVPYNSPIKSEEETKEEDDEFEAPEEVDADSLREMMEKEPEESITEEGEK